MLHGLGFSVEYKRLLRVEEQVEQSIIRRMKQNDEESTFLLMLSCADKCSSTLTALTSQKQKLMIVERLSMGQVSSSPTSLFSPGDQGKFETPTSTQSTLIRRIVHRKLNFSKSQFDWKPRPFPRSLVPLFQSESKCKTILIKMTLICMKIGNCMQFHFHMKGFALRLVLK